MSDTQAASGGEEQLAVPWGPWATLGLGLLVIIGFVFVQVAVAVAYLLARFGHDVNADPGTMAAALETNGLLLAVSTLATAVTCTGLIALFAHARGTAPVREYLRLQPVRRNVLLYWIGIILLAAVCWDLFTWLLSRPVVPVFTRAAYATAGSPILFWLALVVGAPVFEELFFRGFLLAGLRRSRLGASGAVLLTALMWAATHLQYDLFEISGIFIFGLILGTARVRTASTVTPMVMHALLNFVSLAETALFVGRHIGVA